MRATGGDGKVVRRDCRVEPEVQKLGWPLGSMDGRGIAGGGWRGGERSGSWTELMESVVVNRRGVICGKLRKAMVCGATGGMGTGRNGRVKLTLKTLG